MKKQRIPFFVVFFFFILMVALAADADDSQELHVSWLI
jgi:hypothetical protein